MKRILAVVVFASATLGTAQTLINAKHKVYTPPALPTGATAQWNLTGLAGGTTTVSDLAGSHTLTLVGSPALVASGVTFGSGKSATTPDATDLRQASDFTVIVVEKASVTTFGAIASKRDSGGTVGFDLGLQTNLVRMALRGTGGNSYDATFASPTPTDGNWHMVVSGTSSTNVFSQLDQATKVVVSAVSTTRATDSVDAFYVGARINGSNFSGVIAYVVVYERALNDTEIASAYGWLKTTLAGAGVSLP